MPQKYTIKITQGDSHDRLHGNEQRRFVADLHAGRRADYGFAAGHTLTSNEFTVGAAAVDDTPQFIWNPTTHVLYWDSDGNGSHAAVIIAGFQNGGVVTASDIHFT